MFRGFPYHPPARLDFSIKKLNYTLTDDDDDDDVDVDDDDNDVVDDDDDEEDWWELNLRFWLLGSGLVGSLLGSGFRVDPASSPKPGRRAEGFGSRLTFS